MKINREEYREIISIYDDYIDDFAGVFCKDSKYYVVTDYLKNNKIYETLDDAILYMFAELWSYNHRITICDGYKDDFIFVDTANYKITIDGIEYDF